MNEKNPKNGGIMRRRAPFPRNQKIRRFMNDDFIDQTFFQRQRRNLPEFSVPFHKRRIHGFRGEEIYFKIM